MRKSDLWTFLAANQGGGSRLVLRDRVGGPWGGPGGRDQRPGGGSRPVGGNAEPGWLGGWHPHSMLSTR